MARPGPDPQHQIRAFELLSEGRSLPQVAEILRPEVGRLVDPETVRRWAKIGAIASSWLRETAENEDDNTTGEFVRQKYVHFLDNMLSRGFDEIDKGGALYKDIAPIMARLAKEQTLALGGYAAARIDISGPGSPAVPDPAVQRVIDAMRAQQRQAESQLSGKES